MFDQLNSSYPIIAIVGPTGSGKSALALKLAKQISAEIINADAMQLYKGMDIGTAKLSKIEQQGIKHHLLDVLQVTDEASVAKYQEESKKIISFLQNRNKPVILVGGSGLYVRAALDHLDFPGTDLQIRADLEAAQKYVTKEMFHKRLALLDPVAAEKISVNDSRRIVRALEVIQLTGKPFSSYLPKPNYVQATVQIGLQVERNVLRKLLDLRVQKMWSEGFVEEVIGLDKQGLSLSRTASRALGYSQILGFLRKDFSQEYAKERTIIATQQFAKRQMTWFGRDERIVWFAYDDEALCKKVLKLVNV